MKISGKMCLKIILKVTKNQGFTLSIEDAFFKKPQGGGKIDPPPPTPSPSRFRVNLINFWKNPKEWTESTVSCLTWKFAVYLNLSFKKGSSQNNNYKSREVRTSQQACNAWKARMNTRDKERHLENSFKIYHIDYRVWISNKSSIFISWPKINRNRLS